MNINEMTKEDYELYKNFYLSGKGDMEIWSEQTLAMEPMDDEEKKLKDLFFSKNNYIDQWCNSCGKEVPVLVVETKNIHKLKTICYHCHGFIKFGWPFKYEVKQ